MRRPILVVATAIVLSSCGGSTSNLQSTTTVPITTTTAVPPTAAGSSIAAPSPSADATTSTAGESGPAATSPVFCQATTEFNAIMVLSAFSGLTGDGAQDLFTLSKLPELTASASRMEQAAPPRLEQQAASLAAYYRSASDFAADRGLTVPDLEVLAENIESEDLTIDQLLEELGIASDDLASVFSDAAAAVGDMEPPLDLLGAQPSDVGCDTSVADIGACEVLTETELVPLLGSGYTTVSTPIEGFGESCTIRGDGIHFIDITVAGLTFYLPGVWNEIEMIDGVGDEAFLTTGLNSPYLYAKQGNVVVSVSAANFEPALTIETLSRLTATALDRAAG